MHSLRKFPLYFFLLLSIAGCIVSANYLGVNIKEIPDKVFKMQEERVEQDAQEKETIGICFQACFKGQFGKCILFLERISIDLSAVTPFILLWFFSSFSRGSWKLIREKELRKKVKTDETFPLPKSYETTWIQLGFTGTLWGFLIIGLRMEQARSGLGEEAVDILIKAFGTALLSTFTAVVMVYIIAPSVRNFYRWAIGIPYEPPSVPHEITTQLRALSSELKGTTNETSNLKGEIESLKDRVSSLSPDAIAQLIKNVGNKMDNQHKEIQIIRAKAEEEIKKQDELIKHLREISQTGTSFTGQLDVKLEDLTTAIKEASKGFQAGFEEAREATKEEIGASIRSLLAQIKGMFSNCIATLKSFVESKINTESASLGRLNERLDENRRVLEKEVRGIKNALNELHLERKESTFRITEKPKDSKWSRFFLRLIGRK